MNKRLKVLSIDFDYFLRAVDPKAWNFFPDSHCEFGTELQTVIWSSIYASAARNGFKMEELFGVDQAKLDQVMAFLQEHPACEVIAADSHVRIFSVITDALEHRKLLTGTHPGPIDLAHIDDHHDSRPLDTPDQVDCGNWVTALHKQRLIHSVKWYCNDESSTECINKKVEVRKDLNEALAQGPFDIIFLCRSGAFVPPHLDDAFAQLCAACTTSASRADKPIMFMDNCFVSRYTGSFKADAENLNKAVAVLNAQKPGADA